MAKSRNQRLKILYLAKFLLDETDEEHILTTQQLISRLDSVGISAERKTIYENIEDLRLFGLDIVMTNTGRSSGYFVSSREFELPELKLLVDAVQSSRFITRKKSDRLIDKIASLASIYQKRELSRQVFVANRIKNDNESIYYNVDKIHNAINSDVMLSFLYVDWTPQKEQLSRHGGKRYEISPWALSWDSENYYMIGFDTEADIIKHYRVDKMKDIRLTETPRRGHGHFEKFDVASYSRKMFGMFGGREEIVEIRFKNELAGVVIDRFGRDVPMIAGKDGYFTVKVKAFVSPQFYSWIFAYGEDAKILHPKSVADEFLASVQKITASYAKFKN